ncbi:pyridine nucleotide-disulfide oxidoreductase domain-containing protein 2 isoform X2 [Caretta caretta]|uniref:pyridine nucleotide-disulfide oxidoreductase domain-containing protein 2 isoform X2 n=1 Tax=Caretta caretta TaxID=8467 RepID=UPI00209630D9|nr:pyridine nucleotide-disulfide oxidoreductase domain-containing protein 2 isoform X2 [Caretta caretta]
MSLPGPWPVVGLAQLQALPRPSPALTPPVPPLREVLTRQRGPGLAGVQLLVPVTAMAVGRGLGRAWAGCSRQGRRLAHAGARGQLQREYDAVVIGGGHNGLVAAAYLQKSGVRTAVLERRHLLGGAAVTEEIVPGFKFSRASYLLSLLRPQISTELELQRHGLRVYARDPYSFTPMLEDGQARRSLLLGHDMADTQRQIAQFSSKDAQAYPKYEAFLSRLVSALDPLLDAAPVDPSAWSQGPLLQRLRALRGLQPLLRADLGSLVRVGAPESDPGYGCSDRRHGQSPHARQRVRVAAPRDGRAGGAEGGLGLRGRRHGRGVPGHRQRSCCPRDRHLHREAGRPRAAGPPWGGAGCRPAGRDRGEEQTGSVQRVRSAHVPAARSPVAVDRLPSFVAAPNAGDGRPLPHHQCSIHLNCEDTHLLHRAFQEASSGEPSTRPMIELCIPSALDPTLAPPGCHVVSLFTQYTPYALAGGRPWDEQEQNAYADRVFDWVEAYAPGFKASVIGRDILTPPALEKIFGLPGGNIFHGAMSLDQLYFARPVPSYSGYRSPIPGLYLCGSGAHPGGGVMGAPGRNAASVALKDFKHV